MPSRIRRALGVVVVAAVASAAGANPLAAQGSPPPAPQVTVTGLVYTQYLYQLRDTLTPHFNNFDITRAYVNVLGRFSGGVGTRVTADIYRNLDGSLGYRLKYAVATYTPQGSQLTYKIGLMHTPWLDWEEALWDYRMQGQMAFERAGYVSASDFGVGVDGKWGPDRVNLQVTVVNGEFYRAPETGQGKDAQARLSVRVMDTDDSSRVGGLRITGYAAYGKTTAGGQRNRFLGMVSYRTKQLTLAGEAAATQDGVLTGPTAANGHVYSAFGVFKVPDSKVAVIGRVDITHKQSGVSDQQTRYIAGLSYQLSPNWRLLADWDYANYQTDILNAANDPTRSQALFQTQFTF
jgi:hypothetical protein